MGSHKGRHIPFKVMLPPSPGGLDGISRANASVGGPSTSCHRFGLGNASVLLDMHDMVDLPVLFNVVHLTQSVPSNDPHTDQTGQDTEGQSDNTSGLEA